MKDLVLFEDHLQWRGHINEIKCKAIKHLGNIKRVMGFNAAMEAKKLLYVLPARSVVSYVTQVWNPYRKQN